MQNHNLSIFISIFLFNLALSSNSYAQFDMNKMLNVLGNAVDQLQNNSTQPENGPSTSPQADTSPPVKKQGAANNDQTNELKEDQFKVNATSKSLFASSNVNVRGGPGTLYDKIGQLKSGEKVEVTGAVDGNDWLQIIYGGRKGYVHSKFLGSTPPQKAEDTSSILGSYDSRQPTHSMTCWTGQTGWKKYEVKGEDIFVDNNKAGRIAEKKGNVFATKFDSFIGPITLILDYDNDKVTQKSGVANEVFNCR